MEFKDGTPVYTIDGKNVGTLDRVVIDPDTKDVTHIVIQKGLLFKVDKVIAVEKVSSASEIKVVLTCSADELKLMAPLDVVEYMPINRETGGKVFDPLANQMYNNSTPADRAVTMETKRTIPDNLAALKVGSPVVSADDERVGSVEHIFTEASSEKVTHFIISQGLLLKTRRSIPIEWVRLITDDEVILNVPTQKLEELTEVQG